MSDSGMNDLEQALALLKPSAAALDRDRLMFRLGQTSRRRGRWFWPATTALASAAAVVLGCLVWLQPPLGATKVQIVRVEVPVPTPSLPPDLIEKPGPVASPSPSTPPPPSAAVWSAWHLQQQVLRFGADALPVSTLSPDDGNVTPLRQVPLTAGLRNPHHYFGDN